MKKTRWFSAKTSPKILGVYQVEDEGDEYEHWAFWNGERFCWRSWVSPQHAFENRDLSTVLEPRVKWRGLSEDPNKKDKS